MTTRWEVERALLKSQLPSLARLLLLTLLSKATTSDATIPPEHTPALDEIATMTGMSKSSAAEWLAVLEPAGWVTRFKPEGKTKYDRTQYRLDVGDGAAALPKRGSRKAKKDRPSGPLSGLLGQEDESVSQAPAEPPVSDPSSPLSGTPVVRSADRSSPLSGPTLISVPKKTIKPSSDPSNPTPNKPAIVKPAWVVKDTKPKPDRSAANTATPAGRQPSLIAKTDVKLMEGTQIVWDWLIAAGYDTFTTNDARAIHRAIARRYPGRTVPAYLRTMAENDSLTPFAEERRTQRAKEVDALIVELEKTRPMCEHGTLAGQEPHPTHGVPLCAQCRRGLPAAEQPQRTHPDVDAALTEYRKHYAGDFDIQQIINLAQQAEALHRGGASRDDLIALAGIAAARNIGFITAARKDTHV